MGHEARDAGFTLVEALVSMAITAFIALMVVQVLQATSIINRTTKRLSAQEEVEIVREHLRRAFAGLASRRLDGRRPAFLGRPDRLVAVIDADPDLERGSELQMILAAAPTAAGLALTEDRRIAYAPSASGVPEVLLDRITGLHLRYFGAQGRVVEPSWQNTWTRRDRPPYLVEIAVDFSPLDSRRWTPIVLQMGFGS